MSFVIDLYLDKLVLLKALEVSTETFDIISR